MLKYETLVLGPLDNNCYLIWDEDSKQCFIIDPADDGVGISDLIESKGLKLTGILLTHGHFDHTLAAMDLKLIYNVPLYCHSEDLFLLHRQDNTASYFLKREINLPKIEKIDIDLKKIKKINLGEEELKVIKTPGHTPGGVCFYYKKSGLLFSGDTLFDGLRGRTDFSYSSTHTIFKSLKKLLDLPKKTLVLPGHGGTTTIEKERLKYKF